MHTLETIKERIAACAAADRLFGPKAAVVEGVVPVEILCSDGEFAAVKLASGKYAGIWAGHVDVVEAVQTKPENSDGPALTGFRSYHADGEFISGILNSHELTLLEYQVKR